MTTTRDFIEFKSITKTFGGVTALDGVTFSVAAGECHGLMGENGAGKSTLGKILAGIYRPDSGTVTIEGRARVFDSPADARAVGIGMVHQELAFCPDLSIAENLSIGQYPRKLGVMLDPKAMARRAERLLGQIGVVLNVARPMRSLSTAQEQMIQIAAAVGTGAKILVFDEPTSSLSEPEAENLFALIGQLKAQGVTMIYVTHRMPEAFRLCDRLSVLRDGKYVGALTREEASENAVVRMMIGREVTARQPKHLASKPGETVLKVERLRSPGKFEDVSFEVRAGEVVGFAGLVGAGRSEVAVSIFGLDPNAEGKVSVEGKELPPRDVRAAMDAGIALAPEDRKRQGLVLMMGGRQNFSLAMLNRLKKAGMIDTKRERALTQEYFDKLRVKTTSLDAPVSSMSGGNQQKVALAKWLGRQGRLLIVDEPTRGVDVGAKASIHELIDDLACQGIAIMLISSELPELLSLSTRVIVMRDGKMAGELSREEATQENVLCLMAGVCAEPEPEPAGAGA